MTVGARGAAEVAKRYLQRFTRRTSCPYWVGTEGLNSYAKRKERNISFF
jgi:hypothetical protein